MTVVAAAANRRIDERNENFMPSIDLMKQMGLLLFGFEKRTHVDSVEEEDRNVRGKLEGIRDDGRSVKSDKKFLDHQIFSTQSPHQAGLSHRMC